MTSRERWTVYPLLFLALGMASVDKLGTPSETSFRAVSCQQLVVRNVNGQPLVQLGASDEGDGVVEILRPENGGLPSSPASIPWLEISANERGGYLQAFGDEDRPAIFLGYRPEQEFGGLMAIDNGDDLLDASATYRGAAWGVHCLRPEATKAEDAPQDSPPSN